MVAKAPPYQPYRGFHGASSNANGVGAGMESSAGAAARHGDAENDGSKAAQPASNQVAHIQAEMMTNWSPTKLASLQFFLNSNKPAPPQHTQPALNTLSSSSLVVPKSADITRPYLGLKFLLSAGPSGACAAGSWTSQQQAKAPAQDLSLPAPPRAPALAPSGNRFNPYGRPM